MLNKLKKILQKKIKIHTENNIFYLRILIHVAKYFLLKNFRKTRCLVDPTTEFFYKYKKLADYFSIPLLILGKYFARKKIFISVNNEWNFSVGHIYCETDQLKRMQKLIDRYSNSQIWFTSSRKDILGDTQQIFNSKNFSILIGGIKRLLLTFVAIKYPAVSIDASTGNSNYVLGNKNLSPRIAHHNKSKLRANLISKSPEFFPNRDKLNNYSNQKSKLMKELNITKKYIIIQIKSKKGNATLSPLSPELYLETIKYFQHKGYEIVLAGREKCPEIFLNNNVIDYANSRYISALNDFLIVGYSSLVISSASGFCNIAKSLDKPILIMNGIHGVQEFGRRTIILPMLIACKEKLPNANIPHKYFCTYGPDYFNFSDDLYIHHILTSKEILEGAKELEGMLSNQIPIFTQLQKKIRDDNSCPLLSDGLSRISDYFLTQHQYFYVR
jgi:putative glycosyltransferase (TIGR04372 family)